MKLGDSVDVAIIGSGPAGLFAAYQLSRLSPKLNIQLLSDGPPSIGMDALPSLPISEDGPVSVKGLGGSGALADKLYFDFAGGWLEYARPEYARALMAYVGEIFERFGGLSEGMAFAIDPDIPQIRGLEYKAYKIVPLNSFQYRAFLEGIIKKIRDNNVRIHAGASVKEISIASSGFVLRLESGTPIRSRTVLIATGRSSASWVRSQAAKLGLVVQVIPPYFGVRLETNTESVRKLMQWGLDPKFKMKSLLIPSDTKTHCFCFDGRVISCLCDDMVLIDGTKIDRSSSNTSFNVITRIPSMLSTEKGRDVVRNILQEGNGMPLVQRLGDFRKGIPSNTSDIRSNPVRTTLTNATPGEINHHLPPEVLNNLSELLDLMSGTIPEIKRLENLVYAPVFEWFSPVVQVDELGQTSISGLYVTGDAAGISQGVVMAAASGLWTAIQMADLV